MRASVYLRCRSRTATRLPAPRGPCCSRSCPPLRTRRAQCRWLYHISGVQGVVLYECASAALCPKLKIRAAKVEDFDDLVPIFDRQGDVLRQQCETECLPSKLTTPDSARSFSMTSLLARTAAIARLWSMTTARRAGPACMLIRRRSTLWQVPEREQRCANGGAGAVL